MLDTKNPLIVALTGAGISAESGLKTFRGHDGLWEGYDIYEVATPEAWAANPTLVQEFYNMRRKAVLEAEPNLAHLALAELAQNFNVEIITQNIDNLHELAGSKKVMHLHGEITKARSTKNPSLVYDIDGWELRMGQTCELGSQLRPHIVWFGESVPMIEPAAALVQQADIVLVIGTSLQVYPAAGLVDVAKPSAHIVVIDPSSPPIQSKNKQVTYIQQNATTGVPFWMKEFLMR